MSNQSGGKDTADAVMESFFLFGFLFFIYAIAVAFLIKEFWIANYFAVMKGYLLGGLSYGWADYLVLSHLGLGVVIFLGLAIYSMMPKTIMRTIEGYELKDYRALQKLERPLIKRKGAGIEIGKLVLSRVREVAHFLLIGLPGSGKSVFINFVSMQALKRGDKAVFNDVKGDFIQWVSELVGSDKTIVYAPWDVRSYKWAIGKDVNNPAAMQETANKWIPRDDKNPFFSDSAQAVTTGLLMSCFKEKGEAWDFSDMSKRLSMPQAELVESAIEGARDIYSGESSLTSALSITYDEDNNMIIGKSAQDVLVTVSSNLKWIHQVAKANKSAKKSFSVKEFVSSDKFQAFILKSDSRFESIGQKLFGAILSFFHQEVASSSMPEIGADKSGMWFFMDEFPQLGKEAGKSIRALQEVGRSKGVRVLSASQDESQLLDIYGREGGRVQGSLQQTTIFGQLNGETAKAISQRTGEREVLVTHKNHTNESREQTYNTKKPVISPEDFAKLKQTKTGVEVIVMINAQPAIIEIPFKGLPKVEAITKDFDNQDFLHYVDINKNRGFSDSSTSSESSDIAHVASSDSSSVIKRRIKKVEVAETEKESRFDTKASESESKTESNKSETDVLDDIPFSS